MATDTVTHLKHEALVGGLSNAVFNGLIAWLLLRGGPALTWGGDHSFIGDVIATAFILPLIVALIVIPLQRRKLSRGDLPYAQLQSPSALQSITQRMPGSLFATAVIFGLIGAVLLAPLILLFIYLTGVNVFPPLHYAMIKGVWAGALAAVLVVPMVLYALRPATDR